MKNNNILIVSICNVLKVAIFAVLAVVFDRWWIVLFSLLFMSILQTVNKHRRVCDGCGKKSEVADSVEEAIKKAKQAGWKHFEGTDRDYCPECAVKRSMSDEKKI